MLEPGEKKRLFSSCNVSPVPLLVKLDVVPAVEREIFKGPISVFTEQAKWVNLELRGNKW